MRTQACAVYACLAVSFLLLPVPTIGQEKIEQLILSEVYLDNAEPLRCWIEVYNPADRALVLERFRLSHIKTINVFSKEIQDRGGIEVQPGEYLVLCADSDLFSATYGTEIKPIAVDGLSHLASGGFLVIATKGGKEHKGTITRYGEAERSSHAAGLAGAQVLGFSREGKSYSRRIVKTPTGDSVSDFSQSTPTPGKPNK